MIEPFEQGDTGLIEVVNPKLAKTVVPEPDPSSGRIMTTVVDDDRAKSAKTDALLLSNLSLPDSA